MKVVVEVELENMSSVTQMRKIKSEKMTGYFLSLKRDSTKVVISTPELKVQGQTKMQLNEETLQNVIIQDEQIEKWL